MHVKPREEMKQSSIGVDGETEAQSGERELLKAISTGF